MTEPAAFTRCRKSHKILENSAGEKKQNKKGREEGKKKHNYVREFGGRGGSGGG